VEALAYVNFEPDNGGIILDISEKGLCFRAVAPVEPDDVIRFWFSAEGNRIEAEGRLAWVDENGKRGGVQFNPLSVEAKRKIHNWIAQSTVLPAGERKFAAPAPPSLVPPASASNAPVRSSASAKAAVGLANLNVVSQWLRAPIRWAEFSRGLAAGLIIGLLMATAFLFQIHRRQVGELLIRMGEHIGATPRPQELPLVPVHEATIQERSIVSEPAPKSAPPVESRPSQVVTKPVTFPMSNLKSQKLATAVPPISPTEPLPVTNREVGFPIPTDPAKVVAPESAGHLNGEAKVLGLKPAGHLAENAEDIAELNSGLPLGKYFEIGKFKEELRAYKTMDDLALARFHAIVIPKNLLWMQSYQVLVGPYDKEEQAQGARKELQSQGFRPRSLPRRSREFNVSTSTKPNRFSTDILETCVVSWESYGADATVKFVKGENTVAAGKGKWVERSHKYDFDAVVYDRNQNGSRTLLELRFGGTGQALVFPAASGNPPIIF
jgi:PilZ domain/SPOR domain